MDIREQPKQSPKELEEIADLDASNESLIYNLVKRVDLRNQILTQFNEALTRPRSKLSFIDKYVHSWTVLVWTGAAAAYMAYRRRFNMPSVVFNGCALLSLNQYYKKSRAMEVSNELAAEYTEVQDTYNFILGYRSRDYRLVQQSWIIKDVPEQSCHNYMHYRLM